LKRKMGNNNIRMNQKFVRLIALIIIFGFFRHTTNAQIGVDSLAENFSLNDFQGKNYSLKEHLGGKLTIVIFWATWGHDSSEMIDTVEELYKRYHEQGLEAVGVCVEQQLISDTVRQRISETIKKNGITFPIVLDDKLHIFRQYNIVAVPTTYVLNAQRNIVHHLSGYTIVGREQMFEFVREQFEGKRDVTIHKKFEREPDKKSLRVYNMAEIKFYKSQYDTAKKYLLESIASDSLFLEPHLLLIELGVEVGALSEADAHLRRALQLNPKSVEALSLSGLLAAKKGEKEKSVKMLEEVVSHYDSSASAHCYLGFALGINGKPEQALMEFAKAEALAPSNYRIPQLRAEVYSAMGKQQEAVHDKLKAKKLRKSY
jgi:Flp pilus assembly protein TadD/thiol-disulfide isomerase/thioredoxin